MCPLGVRYTELRWARQDVTESYFSNCITLSWGYTGSLLEAWKGRAIHKAVGGLCEQPHLQSFSKRGCVFSGLSSLLNGCKSYWLLLGRPFLLSHMAWSVISISSYSLPSWFLGLPLLRHHQKWSRVSSPFEYQYRDVLPDLEPLGTWVMVFFFEVKKHRARAVVLNLLGLDSFGVFI